MFFAANWWESFAIQCPQLQKFAIRVLSQTCSASRCEHNWSIFDPIHAKKRKHLEQQKLNDLVFMQCDIQLRHNQLLNQIPNVNSIILEDIDISLEWVVES